MHRAHAARRSTRRETRAELRARREREHVERFRAKNRKRFAAPSDDVPVHKRETFRRVQAYRGDASGRSIQWWLSHCDHKAFVALVCAAALAPLADGTKRYTWKDDRARAIACMLIVLFEESRKTRTGRICRGVSLNYLRAVLAHPFTGVMPAITTLNGRHRRDGSLETGEVGWLRAAIEAGAITRKQYKRADVIAAVCQPWELSKPDDKGRVWPMNWYWFPPEPLDVLKRPKAELAEYIELQQRGAAAPYEPIVQRVRFARAPMSQAPP